MTALVDPFSDSYPYLDQLLGGWFHQDYDIDGDVPDIIPKFAASVDTPTLWATIADIQRFLLYRQSDVAGAFTTIFRPDIDPAGWGMTVERWLRWVEGLLLEEVGRR